jgi:hypothetical protein
MDDLDPEHATTRTGKKAGSWFLALGSNADPEVYRFSLAPIVRKRNSWLALFWTKTVSSIYPLQASPLKHLP